MPAKTTNQVRLDQFIQQFCEKTEYGAELVRYLKRSDCGIWRAEWDRNMPDRWWLNITLPDRAQEMFDIHLEIQVLYVEYERVEPRLFADIQQRILHSERVDKGIVILASKDPNVRRLLARRRGQFAAVDLNLLELSTDAPDIRAQFARVLTGIDHFDITRPIVDPAAFFGRSNETQEIMAALDEGQSVGIFGLRKAGKTSLLNYIRAKREEQGKKIVSIDISQISSADDFCIDILQGAWKVSFSNSQTSRNSDSLPTAPRLRTLNRKGECRVSTEDLRLHWLRDLRSIAEAVGQNVEIFIDEIDQADPSRSALGSDASGLRAALTQMRGLVQSAEPGRGLVLVCAGVDPAIFERPVLETGADNLLYKLVRLKFLAPLSEEEMAIMIRDLGRRMGVRIRDHEVIDLLYRSYGGHPLLTRKACSLACKERPLEAVPWHMSVGDVQKVLDNHSEGSPYKQAAELLESFTTWFPKEGELIAWLWSPDPEDRAYAEVFLDSEPDYLPHAAPYGILCEGSREPRIQVIREAVQHGRSLAPQ